MYPAQRGIGTTNTSTMDRISNVPTEIMIYIVGSMRLPDMLTMRLASRHWNNTITSTANQRAIARHHLSQGYIPPLALELYPPPKDPDLEYIASLWYRFDISCQLVSLLIQDTDQHVPRRRALGIDVLEDIQARQRAIIRAYETRCPAVAFAIFHLLEEYRHRAQSPFDDNDHNQDVGAIMSAYDDDLLRGIHHFGSTLSFLIQHLLVHDHRLEEGALARLDVPGRVAIHLLWLGGLPALVRAMRRSHADGDRGRSAVYRWHRAFQNHVRLSRNAAPGSDTASALHVTGDEHPALFKGSRPMQGLPLLAAGRETRPLASTLRTTWIAVSARKLKERGVLGQAGRPQVQFKAHDWRWMRSELAEPLEALFRGSHFGEMPKQPIWQLNLDKF